MAQNKVLLIGFDPHSVVGVDAAMVESAIAMGDARLRAHGFDAEYCLVTPDAGDDVFMETLRSKPFDCVVVGGGIRKPEPFIELFERIINLIHTHAPQAAITFNTTGENSVDAVLRWLPDPTP